MKTLVDLDAAEAAAKARFDAKKAEGAAIEHRMQADKEAHQQVVQDLTRLQGEYQAIQNLKSQAEGGSAEGPTAEITSPAPAEDASKQE